MQCFHCQSVCSGRDSWSPIFQSIWELQQKALSPVNTKQRRTEHCKGCMTEQAPHLCSVTLTLLGAGAALEFIHINTNFKVTVHRSWLQPSGASVSSWRDVDVPRLPLQDSSVPCFPNVKRIRVVLLSPTQQLKLYNPNNSVKGIKQVW